MPNKCPHCQKHHNNDRSICKTCRKARKKQKIADQVECIPMDFSLRRDQLQAFLECPDRPRPYHQWRWSSRLHKLYYSGSELMFFDRGNDRGNMYMLTMLKDNGRFDYIVVSGTSLHHDHITSLHSIEKFESLCCNIDEDDDEDHIAQVRKGCSCDCPHCTQKQASYRNEDLLKISKKTVARLIQRMWRYCVSNPKFWLCRNRLLHEYNIYMIRQAQQELR